MIRRGLTLLLAATLAATAFAEEGEGEEKVWSGDAEVGGVWTSGNTDNQTLKLRFDVARETGAWTNKVHAESLEASQDGETTAQRVYAFYRLDYSIDEDQGMFTRAAIDDDKFSGYDIQADWTAGYNRKLIKRDNLRLEGDLGAGARYLETETGDETTEFLVRFAAALEWDISDNAKFFQGLAAEVGEELTTVRSETSLTANIASSLAMKVAYLVKHNSEVPPGRKKTDTEATVTLVYSF